MIQHNLNEGNYFSVEKNLKYIGASQFKSFLACEDMALAEIQGKFEREKTTALLVGSYVDAHFEGTLDIFKAKNPEIFTQKGELKSQYQQADYIINRIERDELFMKFMSGQKQVIMVGEIEDVPVKIKVDSLHPNMIVDGKVMKDFESVWVADKGKLHFIEAWGYDIQGAIYQEIVRQNTGELLPFYIAAATKEKEPDIGLFSIPQTQLDYCMDAIIKPNIVRFDAIKKGIIEPERCGWCDWCKRTKVLTEIIDYTEVAI